MGVLIGEYIHTAGGADLRSLCGPNPVTGLLTPHPGKLGFGTCVIGFGGGNAPLQIPKLCGIGTVWEECLGAFRSVKFTQRGAQLGGLLFQRMETLSGR